MSRLHRLLLVSFLESVAILLVQRGVFFFTHERLGFSDVANLWLGAAAGVTYVVGALSGAAISRRLGERRTLMATLVVQILCCLAMAAGPGAIVVICTGTALVFGLNGMKWALVESFLTAGQTPARTAQLVGLFNVSWSLAVPVGVAASGPLIEQAAPALFLAGIPITLLSIWLLQPLEAHPVHLPDDHPHRPREQVERYRCLLVSGRWSLLTSYTLMFLLAPLLPQILIERLGFSAQIAPAISSLMDVARCAAFVFMQQTTFWRGRLDLPLIVTVVMPAAFFAVLLGHSAAMVIAGSIIFGFAIGLAYNAALYYAMVVANGSVHGGGGHEAMVGGGFALGPLSGLLGKALATLAGGATLGMIAGIAPALTICSAGALWPILRLMRSPATGAGSTPMVGGPDAP